MHPAETAIVVPCYDEAARLAPRAFVEALAAWPWLRLVLVDDGSRDNTPVLLRRIASGSPQRVEVLVLPSNRGKGEAVRQGLQLAMATAAPIVGYWDADLSTPLSELRPMCECLRQRHAAMVLGSRVKLLGRRIRRRASRHYTGRVFATLASLTLDLPVYDTQCGAKVFRNDDQLAGILAEPFGARWIFDVELLARFVLRLRAAGIDVESQVVEHPLRRWTHDPGSRIRVRDGLRALVDLARIYRELRAGAGGSRR